MLQTPLLFGIHFSNLRFLPHPSVYGQSGLDLTLKFEIICFLTNHYIIQMCLYHCLEWARKEKNGKGVKKKKKKRVVESSKGYLALVSKENERTSLHLSVPRTSP